MDGDIASQNADAANTEMIRLWRTWKTVLELLVDRVGTPPPAALDQS
jgi:hypothetical protein